MDGPVLDSGIPRASTQSTDVEAGAFTNRKGLQRLVLSAFFSAMNSPVFLKPNENRQDPRSYSNYSTAPGGLTR